MCYVKNRCAFALTVLLAVASSVFASAPAYADTTIDNGPPVAIIGTFGKPHYASFGQTITVPATDTKLTSFTFHIMLPNTQIFRAEVYAWDGTKATGPSLYESAPTHTTGSGTATEPVTFNTGGVNLVAGAKYVLFVSVSKDYEATTGFPGYMGYTNVDSDPDNKLVFLDTGTDESLWTTSNWATRVEDLALKATFTSPVDVAPGQLLISEYRLAGPGGAADEFIEVYNNTDSQHVVGATGGGYAVVSSSSATLNDSTPTLRCTIPAGTTIPARGHFLCVNTGGYSLTAYPAGSGTTATGDATYTSDTPVNDGVALFSTTSPAAWTLANRIDAVGSKLVSNDLYREGGGHSQVQSSVVQYSFVRRLPGGCTGFRNDPTFAPNNRNCASGAAVLNTPGPLTSYPQDTGDNMEDFLYINNLGVNLAGAAAENNVQQRLGAPGPENTTSPVAHNSRALALGSPDATKGVSVDPNRVRDTTCALTGGTCDPNAIFGYLDIRRRVQNNTGAPVTRLRFRAVDISATPTCGSPQPACTDGQIVADVRAITSADFTLLVNDSQTCATTPGASSTTAPCTVPVDGTTLETPPTQQLAGGFNSSLSANASLGSPLQPGQSVVVNWRLVVRKNGKFRFFVTVEALPFQ